MGLTRILDECQLMARGHLLQRSEIGRLPIKVHRQDGASARRDCGRGRGGIEREPLGIDVGKHGRRAGHHDRQRRVGGGKR